MGLMDKVKAQATVLADKAQTGIQQGQAKLTELQSGRQADHLLRQLGAYVFLGERGRPQPDAEAAVAKLLAELDAVEAAGTPITVAPDPTAVPPGGAVPAPGPAEAAGPVPPAGGTIPQAGGGLPGE